MVGVLDVDAELLEREDRLAAHVGAGVERRQVEVAALVEHLGRRRRSGFARAEVEVLELGADVEGVEAHRPRRARARGAGSSAGRPRRARRPGPGRRRTSAPVAFSSGRQGSTAKVAGSGMAIMSDSSIGLKPVIEEPSKPMPPSKASSSSAALIEKLFSWPRMSVNQRRMKRTSCSSHELRSTSSASGRGAVVGSVVGHRARNLSIGAASRRRVAVAYRRWHPKPAAPIAYLSAEIAMCCTLTQRK